jgi:superfamily II DNA or RNA helicase
MAETEAIAALAEAARKACPPRAWSRGVILAREDAVEGREEKDDELLLEVRVPERPVPHAVVLYLETGEWDCDCEATVAVCAHTAAAIIALTQARADGQRLPRRRQAGLSLRYRFFRDGPQLRLERLLVRPGGEVSRLAENLSRWTGQRSGPQLSLGEADLALEPFFRDGVTTLTMAEQAARLLTALAALSAPSEVWCEEAPVRVATERLLPRGRVFGGGGRFTFAIGPDPALTEVLADGLALAGDALRPLGELVLAGARWEKLPIERTIGRAEVAQLVAETIPSFAARFPVEVATSELPALTGELSPRLDLGVRFGLSSVSVTPRLLYGDPPRLAIEDGRAVHLSGAVPRRDLAAERRLLEALRERLELVPNRTVEVRGKEVGPFLDRLRAFTAMEESGAAAPRIARLEPVFDLSEGRLELDFGVAPDDEGRERGARRGQVEPAQVLEAYAAGESYVPLLGGGWAEVPKAFLAEHGERLRLLLELRDADGKLAPAARLTLARLCEALDQPAPPEVERLRPLFAEFTGLPAAELPRDLVAELRPYQQRGVDWLCFLRDAGLGALLADDMGLGKTLQTICAIRGRTLIVCPTSVLWNWAAELARFRPGLSVAVFHGPGRVLDADADVTVTTYALLRGDLERLQTARWEMLVLDEAQAIKNADSQTARAAFALEAGFRVALTGTPVENRLEELWSQLHFANRGLLHGRAEFTARFARPIAEGDQDRAALLRERIRPFVLRRKKSEVARELPPRTDMVLYAELDGAERALYDAVQLATREDVVARLRAGASVMAALEALLRLRQASCHPALVPGQSAATSAKVETLLEALTEAVSEGHKALVFSQWTSLLDLVEPHLSAAGLSFARLDGSTADRADVVQRFQSPDGPPVMLLSLKAGGTGLNLTAADHVFLLDPWWNPAAEDQAADRAHRIGQERPVMVYRLVARGTVEERILALQERKRALAASALDEGGAALSLTREDLLGLLDG